MVEGCTGFADEGSESAPNSGSTALAACLFRPGDLSSPTDIEGHEEVASWQCHGSKDAKSKWIYQSAKSGFEVELFQNDDFGLGGKVWTVSLELCRTLERSLPKGLAKCRILELGSGCGLTGLVLAHMGHNVLLTDTPAVQPHLNANVEANRSKLGVVISAAVDVLAFGNDADAARIRKAGPYHLIVGADITFLSHIRKSLLRSLLQLCGPETIIVIGHTSRDQESIERVVEEFGTFFEVGAPLYKGEVQDPYELGGKIRRTTVITFRRREPVPTWAFEEEPVDLAESDDRERFCEVCGSPMAAAQHQRCEVCPACLAEF